jgi:pimeloyl-ACP methyl ester carboxylesterase
VVHGSARDQRCARAAIQGSRQGFGSILPAAEAERFAAAAPSARVVEIDANHYTITTHDDSIAAIGAFLRTS